MRTDPFPPAVAGERALDRRRFLCAAGSAAILVAAGEWTARRAETVRTPPPGRVTLPPSTQLAVGEACEVTAPDGTAVIAVRLDTDRVVAFERRCPHLGCPVVWAAARGRFECPCHGAAFDALSGQVLFGPPRRGLAAVEIV